MELFDKIDELSDQMIADIKKIVQINSIQSEPLENMPYGKGVDEALNAALELSKKLGFEVENVDHQVGIAKYGDGDDYIGIIGHLDVVDIDGEWKYGPFSGSEVNGRIFSRGILDNKGPIISCLYALYAIKCLNIKLKHPVWILFGTNEETGFADVKHYLKVKKPPIMGFTPDCKYPVVYAERGRCVYRIDKIVKDLELNYHDDEFGYLQYSLNQNDDHTDLTFRYPASINTKWIHDRLVEIYGDIKLELVSNYDPVYFDSEGFLCQCLKQTYEEVTHLDGTPVTTTGGTYAKLMPNIVPFGPSFPGQKGIGHKPDEWMDRKDLILNAKIYALSILQLGNEELK